MTGTQPSPTTQAELHRQREERLTWEELRPDATERVKRVIRGLLYPPLVLLTTAYLKRQPFLRGIRADLVLWDERGNDFQARRRLLDRRFSLRNKTILVAGCGIGRDLLSWLPYRPAAIVGVDLVAYESQWVSIAAECRSRYPDTNLAFIRADLKDLDSQLAPDSVDVVASDAVFEHLRDLHTVLGQMRRVIKPNGRLYATFGPLYRCWGGDHLSGRGNILEEGFNHLLLGSEEFGEYVDRVIREGRGDYEAFWLEQNLLSRLTYAEYLAAFEQDWDIEFHQVIVSPAALAYKRAYPERWTRLTKEIGFQESDLCCKTMTVILRPRADRTPRSGGAPAR